MAAENTFEDYQKSVGLRVKELRLKQGKTQADFCQQCGIVQPYLSRIETGMANPSLTLIVALAKTLQVQVHELLLPPD